MTTMALIAGCLSFVLAAEVIYVLFCFASIFNLSERLGIGMAGSAIFISGFKQLGFAHLTAPFEPTYQVLWRIGWFFFLSGMIYRLWKHKIGNDRQRDQARAYLAMRAGAER